ncbi:hypothetical protein [Parvularcula oceani]|uniref:hypothetical protein n=1 Tax=Parvularcula oceani TaxID=1247963 RepID=UPI00068C52C1|nr:hypothetical protein [Parvularcula oceani]
MAQRRKGRGVDAQGRSKGPPRHVRLYRSTLHSPAYRSLVPAARAILTELYDLYDGQNNGELFLSVRRAAERVHVNKDTAGKMLGILRERGFIKLRVEAYAELDMRYARCWVLTEFPFAGHAPSRDFEKWYPPGSKE